MTETVITVQGSHSASFPPEQARVRLAVEQQGPNREPVVSRVAEGSGSLQRDLAEQGREGGAVSEWSAQGIRVWSERPWSNDGAVLPLVYHSRVDLTATFTEFGTLSAWLEQVAVREGVVVDGIEWQLTEESDRAKQAEVQQRAVQDAVQRATAFAASLGLGALTPVALSDPGMLGDPSGSAPGGAFRAKAMMADAAGGGSGGLAFRPEDIKITATVDARFRASDEG